MQHQNLFVVDSAWSVTTAVQDVDPDSMLSYERLDARLQLHRASLQHHFTSKPFVKHQLGLLKLVSFLATLLVAMRRQMKVPNLSRLLSSMPGWWNEFGQNVEPLLFKTGTTQFMRLA